MQIAARKATADIRQKRALGAFLRKR
jgi:hypothetical protein